MGFAQLNRKDMDLVRLIECLSENERTELRQILIDKDCGKTDIYEFIAQTPLKPSMRGALLHLRESQRVQYVEDITRLQFVRCRLVYQKSWEELVKIRLMKLKGQ